jgi:hypothetical protein
MISDLNVSKQKVISVAWGPKFIDLILTPVEQKLNLEFIHINHSEDFRELSRNPYYLDKLICVPSEQKVLEAEVDIELLALLEKDAPFTINNLVMSDRVLRHLEFEEVLKYASTLAKQFTIDFMRIRPFYIIGAWDSLIQGVAMLVARKMGIPFYIMKFSVIPSQHLAICEYPNANSELDFTQQDDANLLAKAAELLEKWRERTIVAPAYVSAKSFYDIIRMLPTHTKAMSIRFWKILFSKGNNRFLALSSFSLISQYFRKKGNILRMNKNLFITEIPNKPFFFYGLHMQPESSIDVMAPFYSDQYMVIESISRSMPVDYLLLVKIHVSDADNYSNAQIKRLLKIPGVRVVSPFVNSRNFIENSRMLFTVQGTIGLEGALLGKPVIIFGDSPLVKFSSVDKVNTLEGLPELIKNKLTDPAPNTEDIVKCYAKFLKSFLPSCSDDWLNTLSIGLTLQEEENFVTIFYRLNNYVQNHQI